MEGSRIKRLAPQYVPSLYDPNERRVHLPADCTVYQKAHEFAHKCQQAVETRAWRWHARMMHAPYLCRVTRIWLEWEASRMALKGLDDMGLLDDAAKREARKELWGYLTCLVR